MDTESNTSPSIGNIDRALVRLLNGLILVCHDAHDGYMEAADNITSSAYKTMFAEYALQRSRFAAQLANLILDHGGDPDDDGGAMRMFSRGWTNIKAVTMGGDYGAIFTECERSENAAKNAYGLALEKNITKDAYSVINHQYQQIIEAHDRIRNLREAYYSEHKN